MVKKKPKKPHGYRGSSPKKASEVKLAGHKAEDYFAELIGNEDGVIPGLGKADVTDNNGDNHTVKSAKIKWQIFLYARSNFERWLPMNGVSKLLLECIDAFPDEYRTYAADKKKYKEKLRGPMRDLKDKLCDPDTLKLFLSKTIFDDELCQYLTIYSVPSDVLETGKFHMFHKDDVLEIMCKNLTVKNSAGVNVFPPGEQKVKLIYKINAIELEMRNDGKPKDPEGPHKFGNQMRFNGVAKSIKLLLLDHTKRSSPYKEKIILYGKAIDTFKKKGSFYFS